MAVSDGKKTARKLPVEWNWLGVESMEPKLPALMRTQMSSAAAMMNMNGAPKACRWRMDSTPRQTMTILRSQNSRKQAHFMAAEVAAAGQMTASMEWMAVPPIQDWMPNQPQATMARRMAGRFAPRTPKGARMKTGNGIPYLAPAWALSSMGTKTMRLPSRTVARACFQSMPLSIRPEASL